MTSPGYQLSRRRYGGLILGLSAVQSGLLAAGLGAIVLIPTLTRTSAGVIAGAAVAIGCVLAAFVPVQGRPMHLVLPGLVRYGAIRASGRHRWLVPHLRPPAAGPHARNRRRGFGVLGSGSGDLPRCLSGLELYEIDRPSWAGDLEAPVGIIRDARTGTLTVILTVRGTQFDLIDDGSQHAMFRNWGHVLTQFGRESSPMTRLGWSLWSAPRADIPTTHRSTNSDTSTDNGNTSPPREHPVGSWHELRVWISIDPARTSGRRADPGLSALAAAQSLTERCQAAGLAVLGLLSPAEIAQTMQVQADPFTERTADSRRPQAAARSGTGSRRLADAAPQSVCTFWDAVNIESAWHRSFWVAGWPASVTHPQWLHRLLHDPAGVRTITVIYEPISLRASRRRITAEAVALDSQLQLRHKHDFRIPVHLHHAQADIDQREAELGAGWCEYAHLALITITAPTRQSLDQQSQALIDQAAQCGITSLQPVNAHHDAGWAVTLPLGRPPDHDVLTGGQP